MRLTAGAAHGFTRTPPALRPGDAVRFVSPASRPEPEGVERCVEVLSGWGLKVELGEHVFDELDYLAGTDEDRLSDLNDALRSPNVRGIFCTTGGKGAYRIADGLDFDAARNDPKPLIGFSEITILHMALLHRSQLVGVHGLMVSWSPDYVDLHDINALRRAVMTTDPIVLTTDETESTSSLTTTGVATGPLVGGNLGMMATAAGWSLPTLAGCIWFIEDVDKAVGQIDRWLTQLLNAGHLSGIAGVAVGRFLDCDPRVIEVLRDRLSTLHVPILGGLPVGHGRHSRTMPIGTQSILNADR